jgi:hypothetical protein
VKINTAQWERGYALGWKTMERDGEMEVNSIEDRLCTSYEQGRRAGARDHHRRTRGALGGHVKLIGDDS